MSQPTGRESAEQIEAQIPIPWAEMWANLRTAHAREVRRLKALERDRAHVHIVRRTRRDLLTE